MQHGGPEHGDAQHGGPEHGDTQHSGSERDTHSYADVHVRALLQAP